MIPSWRQRTQGILLMAVAIVAAGVFLRPQDPLFVTANPSPFWFLVLLIAVRHGNPAGTIAGGICAGLHLLGMSLHGLGIVEAFQLQASALVMPVLYLAVGAFVGERFSSELRRNEYYQGQLESMRGLIAESESRSTRLEEAYRQLEGRLAGETDTITQFFQNAHQIDGSSVDEIRRNLLQVLEDSLGVELADFWVRFQDGLWRGSRRGAGPLPELGEIALRERRVVTAQEFFAGESRPPEAGLMAGLLGWPDRGVDAVVVVFQMPFNRFTRRAILLFEVLLEWASRVLERQMLLEAVSQRDVFDRDLGLTSEVFFQTSAAKVRTQSKRRGEPCCVLCLRVDGEAIPPETARQARIVMAVMIRRLLRASDIAAYRRDAGAFVLFLPGTDTEQAGVVEEKLRHAATDLGVLNPKAPTRLYLTFALHDLAEDETVETAVAAALHRLPEGVA